MNSGARTQPLESARRGANDVRIVPTALSGSIAARVIGRGPAVLLVHGVTDNLRTWHRFQDVLAGDAETHAVDLPGHGLSDIPTRPLDLHTQAEAVIGYLDAHGIDRCVVVGNSMGGGVALGMANLAPERVSSVVLLGSLGTAFPTPFGLGLLRHRIIAEQMPRIATSPSIRRITMADSFGPDFRADEETHDRYWNAWRVEGRVPYIQQLMRTIDVTEPSSWMPAIRQRVHVVHGSKDRVIPVRVAHAIAERLPNAHTTVLRRIGHMPQIEAPDVVRGFVLRALDTASP